MTVGLLSIANPALGSGIQFNFNFLPSTSGQTAFIAAVNNAASLIAAAFPNTNITLNIRVGYGEFNDGNVAPITLTSSAEGASFFTSGLANQQYATVRSTLISKATSASLIAATRNLPNTATIAGSQFFYVQSSIAKALGMLSATGTAVDGTIGIGSTIPSANWPGVILHELGHAMGRERGTSVVDLVCFSAAATRRIGSQVSGDYFSTDNGVTPIADWGISSDPSDFLNGGVQDGATDDAFDEFYNVGTQNETLSTADIQLMNTLGFQ
jgi:serralysin